MKPVLLALGLLGPPVSTLEPVSTVHTLEVTYVLEVQNGAADPLHPSAERNSVLRALQTSSRRPIWTAAVEPEARNLYLRGSVLLTYSCFSGAYLSCTVQAFARESGRTLWQTNGKLGEVGPNSVLLWDDFFTSDDSPSLSARFQVVRLPEGTRKNYTVLVPPRWQCEGPVELLGVAKFSMEMLEVSFRDSCGTYSRTFR